MSFYKEVPGRQTTLESTLKFDTEPKAGSTNPVTSGGLLAAQKGAIENLSNSDNEGVSIKNPDSDDYVVGKFYYFGGTFNYCESKADGVATFTPYSICEALNLLKGLIDDLGE